MKTLKILFIITLLTNVAYAQVRLPQNGDHIVSKYTKKMEGVWQSEDQRYILRITPTTALQQMGKLRYTTEAVEIEFLKLPYKGSEFSKRFGKVVLWASFYDDAYFMRSLIKDAGTHRYFNWELTYKNDTTISSFMRGALPLVPDSIGNNEKPPGYVLPWKMTLYKKE